VWGRGEVLVEKSEERRQLGKQKRRWENIIKMVIKEIGWGYVDSIDLAQIRDRRQAIVAMVMNFRFS